MKPPHIYIPSKGRPHCSTARLLVERGYKGDITIVVGNDDASVQEYIETWGGKVVVFDKESTEADMMDAYGTSLPSGAAPARQAILDMGTAANEGRFWMMDDDYKDIVIMHGDGTRSSANGEDIAVLLCMLAAFADESDIPIIGFGVNFLDNATPFRFDRKVFTNYGISDRKPVQKWAGRQFEDAVHTISQARIGMPDFRILFAYVVVETDYADTSSGKVGSGGLSDLYSIGGEQSESLNMVRQVGYSVMAHPNGMKLVVEPSGSMSKRFGVTRMVPKTLRDEWVRL